MKLTWKVLRYAIGEGGSSISAIENLELGDDIISDSKKISEICNDHFVTVGERLAGQMPCSDNSLTAHIPKINSVFQLKPVTEGQVLKLSMEKLQVPTIFQTVLKESADIIGPSLAFILNFSIMSRAFPDDLKMGKVTPAFKEGDRDDLGNYRDILIQDSRSKIPRFKIQIQKSRSRNQHPEIKIRKLRSRNQDLEIKIQKSRSRNQDPEIKIQKSRTRNQDPEIKTDKLNKLYYLM